MEVKEVKEIEEVKNANPHDRLWLGGFSVPSLPQFPSLPRQSFSRLAFAIAASAAISIFSANLFAQTSQPSGTTAPPGPAASPAPALSHDLGGVWMPYPNKVVDGEAVVTGIEEKTRPPLTPWGQARFDAAIPFLGPRAIPGKENNPSLRCEPESVPKSLVLPNPFEIVQIPGRIFMFFEEFHLWRTIWTDGRALPKNPDPSYLGYSVGKWDGDTLVVETVGFNDRPWVDAYGNPRSEQMHLTERYRRIDHDTLELQIIMDDPKAYTKTWVSAPRLFKFEPGWEIGEFFCSVDEEIDYAGRVRKPAGGDSAAPK